jgi:hypothetical protein
LSFEREHSRWNFLKEKKLAGTLGQGPLPFLLVAAMVVAVVMPVVFCAKATENKIKTLKLVVCNK